MKWFTAAKTTVKMYLLYIYLCLCIINIMYDIKMYKNTFVIVTNFGCFYLHIMPAAIALWIINYFKYNTNQNLVINI